MDFIVNLRKQAYHQFTLLLTITLT